MKGLEGCDCSGGEAKYKPIGGVGANEEWGGVIAEHCDYGGNGQKYELIGFGGEALVE